MSLTTTDVVVIGGGVIGTAAAYFLAKCRMDVTLIERGGIACGTSGRCEGNVLVQDKLPGFDCQLARLSQELFPVIAQEIDTDIEWIRKGSLLVIESEEELDAAAVFCRQMAAEGLPVRMLDAHEVHEDEPNLASDIVGGLEFACDGALNPMAQRAIRFFPVIRQIQIIRNYAGLRPYTPDHFPIVSETRVPGFYVAAGHEGDGIGLSLITGKLMAQIMTREPTDISIEPLRLDRFEGRTLQNHG
jgi:glycine/D-amino acid oxidase-like deaminating enzyme